MLFSREGAWVTGSSKGIGRAASLGLAEAGCDRTIHYSSRKGEVLEVAGEIESLGRDVLVIQGDVSSSKDGGRMAREVEEHFGRIDIMVNNAGSMVERQDFRDDRGNLGPKMEVNLKSVYLCSQAVLPMMKHQGRGRIINLSSISARDGGSSDSVAYSTTKAWVSTLTRTIAKELAEDGILVNAVSPGRIGTPFHDRFTSREKREEKARSIPLRRRVRRRRSLEQSYFWPLRR